MDFKRKKQLEEELEEELDKALKREETLQHDENEKPITFAKEDTKLE